MARRGRKPGEPSLKGDSYWAWHPGMNRKIPLNTNDFEEAKRIQAGFYQVEEMSPVEVATAVVTSEETKEDNSNAKSLLEAWATTPTATFGDNADTTVVLSTDGGLDAKGGASRMAPQHTPIVSIPGTKTETSIITQKINPKAKKGLSPEDAAKLAKGMKSMLTQLNMVAVGAAVSIFRTEIEKPDQETMDILELGIQMQLDRWFTKSNPEPWMIILGANVIMAVGMWSSGKARMKKPKSVVPGSSIPENVTPIKPGVA